LLSAMEERQLLLRKASETDRRATDVELTDLGKTLADSILPLAQATVDKAFTGFTEDEAEFLRRLLRRIQKNMEAPN
ncbi:MAG TPA: MarR family transcriptional regulator, partial [Rhodocyclaceae bacterium]|nr:MarR family transcriptional regulator [Rhodocyclaceae bacterium]